MDIISRQSDARVFATTSFGTRAFWCLWSDRLACTRGDPPIHRGIAGYRDEARRAAGISRDPRHHVNEGYARRWCPEAGMLVEVTALSHLVDDGTGNAKTCTHNIVFDAGSRLCYHAACDPTGKAPSFYVERHRLRTELATPAAVIANTPAGPKQTMVLITAASCLIKPGC